MKKFSLLIAATLSLLAGCGGGGGGGDGAAAGPVVSALSFPLQSAYSAMVAAGYSKDYTVSGTCHGTATNTVSLATIANGTTFELVANPRAATETLTISYTDCPPAASTPPSTSYYDSNYMPLGTVSGNYSVFLTPPSYPASVTVGSHGDIGTISRYSDATKNTLRGRGDFTYVVDADTANTAIVNIVDKDYDAAGLLIAIRQSRYRIAASGPLVPVSSEVLFTGVSGTHLVFQ